ncbi:MAG: hypothetical protein WDN31_08880 [Hyphomicrobium sp.]
MSQTPVPHTDGAPASHTHAVVWLDFKEAHVFLFNAEDVERERIKAHNPSHKIHQKAGIVGSGHAHDGKEYFDGIIAALAGTTEWLVTARRRPRPSSRTTSRSTLRCSRAN